MTFNFFDPTREETVITAADATYTYFAFAPPGTAAASTLWKVFRVVIASPTNGGGVLNLKQYANGNSAYTNAASTMTAIGSWS